MVCCENEVNKYVLGIRRIQRAIIDARDRNAKMIQALKYVWLCFFTII